MKVHIGPYTNWFGPYQLAEALCFWVKEVEGEYGMKRKPEWVHKFGEFLAHGFAPDEDDKPPSLRKHKDRPETWLYKLLQWIETKKKRKISIHIDKWDTWGMYDTLALIILPMLKQLQATKHGAPFVEDEDVPEHLRSTAAPAKENEWDTDDNHFKRWDWTLEQMIWSFEQLQPGCDWEAQFYSGKHDTYFEVSDTDENGKPRLYQMKRGPEDTFEIDMDGLKAHQEKINVGLKLFGKYFQNLWD